MKIPWSESFQPVTKIESYSKELQQLTLYGIGEVFSYANFDDIFTLWDHFHQAMPRSLTSYGITLPVEDDPEKFHYFVAIESKTEVTPLEEIVIPRQYYQVFKHRGNAKSLMNTFNYIWGTWLPSQHKQIAGIDFERYPPNYDPENDDALVEIFMPVR